ncbi:hypothetical protein ACFVS2_15710 [Brevibacillus sp. NPDC058079]|uniref:hypothetical protein n=1 Tax=Brevibacillus sp. NPDC058079 TaxID=3346330 RepID=UPI0036EE7B9A
MPDVRSDAYFASGSTRSISATNEFYIPLPSGTRENDYLFATVRNNISAESIDRPAGWTQVFNMPINAGRFGVFYKKVNSSDILAGIATFKSVSGAVWYGSLAAYRNVKEVETPGYISYPSGTIFMYPGDITPTKSGSLLLNINTCISQAQETTTPFAFNPDFKLDVSGALQTYKSKTLYTTDTVRAAQIRTNYTFDTNGVSMAVVLVPNANEPPTPPTNVRVDKTSYDVGEPMRIDFTPGTDSDGTISGYVVGQYYPYLGLWSTLSKITTPPPFNIACGGMLDTNISKVRVASVDDKGAMSAWVESPTFTVKQKEGIITVPTTVAGSSYYNTSSSPIVRFDNGWLGQVLKDASGSTAAVFLSKDNGKNWNNFGSITGSFTRTWSIAANNNMLYIIYAHNATTVVACAYDVTQLSGGDITKSATILDTVTDVNSTSICFNRGKNVVSYVYSAKTAGYPASYNLHRGEIQLQQNGHLAVVANKKQLTTSNHTSFVHVQPSNDVNADGTEETIAYRYSDGSSTYVMAYIGNTTNNTWSGPFSAIRNPDGAMATLNPTVRYTTNGAINVFAGSYVTGVMKALFTRTMNRGALWSSTVDLGVATDTAMTVDKDNKVYVYIVNGTTMYTTSSTDGFATFPAAKLLTSEVTTPTQNSLSPFREPSLKTSVTVPPIAFRKTRSSDNAQMVSFLGTWKVAEPPVVTLTSPANNVQLIEGQDYIVTGEALSKSVGAVVNVKNAFGSTTTTIDSYVSDGVTPRAFSKTLNYRNKQLFDGNTAVSSVLSESVMYTMITSATDTTNTLNSSPVYRDFTVKYNMPPLISGTDQDLGAFMQIPSVNYSATDPEANTFTFTEYLNGKQIRSFAGVAGQQYTVEISHDAWIRLDLNMQHQIKIVATDSAGISSERIYTFTRTETHIEFLLEYGNPDIKADFTLDGMPLRVLMTLERYLPEGSAIESVKVCNNYLDDAPTWEDCTGAVKGNRGYLFTNKNKTAPEWAINLWVTINKGTAKERVLVNGYGGAFD